MTLTFRQRHPDKWLHVEKFDPAAEQPGIKIWRVARAEGEEPVYLVFSSENQAHRIRPGDYIRFNRWGSEDGRLCAYGSVYTQKDLEGSWEKVS